jgi:hypothetical protein
MLTGRRLLSRKREHSCCARDGLPRCIGGRVDREVAHPGPSQIRTSLSGSFGENMAHVRYFRDYDREASQKKRRGLRGRGVPTQSQLFRRNPMDCGKA